MVNAMRAAGGHAARSLAGLDDAAVIRYVPFAHALAGKHQTLTQADPARPRRGRKAPLAGVDIGVARCVGALLAADCASA